MPPAKFTCSLQHRRVFVGQDAAQHADDRELRRRDVEDDAELERDDRRRSPAELAHRRDDEVALRDREERLEVADDLHDVADDVGREQHVVHAAGAHAGAQRLGVERAIEPEQPADADQREAVAELNRRELRRDQDQEREALAAVGHLRVDDADGLEREDVPGTTARARRCIRPSRRRMTGSRRP